MQSTEIIQGLYAKNSRSRFLEVKSVYEWKGWDQYCKPIEGKSTAYIYKPNGVAEEDRTRTKSCIADTKEVLDTEHLLLKDSEKNIDTDYQ